MSSIFKRNKIWWVIYYRDGKKVTYSLQTTNRQEAKLRQVKIDYKLATGQAEMPSKTEIVPLLEEYCSHIRLRKCPKPYKTDVSILRYLFGPVCQAIKPSDIAARHANNKKPPFASVVHLEDITPAQINQYLSERVNEGLAPKTVNHYRQVLNSLFNYAVRYHNFRSRDARYPNPVGCIDRFPKTVPEIRFLELEDIDKQLEVLGGHKVLQAAVATLIYAGIRRLEALWLTRSDIDLKKGLFASGRKKTASITGRQRHAATGPSPYRTPCTLGCPAISRRQGRSGIFLRRKAAGGTRTISVLL